MNVVGIGYLITGHSHDDAIKPGATITLSNNQPAFVVDAVEQIEYTEANSTETALILEPVEEGAAELLFRLSSGDVLLIQQPV